MLFCILYWLSRNLFDAVNTGKNLDMFNFLKNLKNFGGGA